MIGAREVLSWRRYGITADGRPTTLCGARAARVPSGRVRPPAPGLAAGRGRTGLAPQAVAEGMRLHPAIRGMIRVAATEVVYGGVRFSPGTEGSEQGMKGG